MNEKLVKLQEHAVGLLGKLADTHLLLGDVLKMTSILIENLGKLEDRVDAMEEESATWGVDLESRVTANASNHEQVTRQHERAIAEAERAVLDLESRVGKLENDVQGLSR